MVAIINSEPNGILERVFNFLLTSSGNTKNVPITDAKNINKKTLIIDPAISPSA